MSTQRAMPVTLPLSRLRRPVSRLDLVNAVAEHADLPRVKAELAVSGLLNAIEDAMRRDQEVRLTGFGTFTVARRKPTTGRNPRTGEPISLSATTSVRFRAGKGLKDAVAAA